MKTNMEYLQGRPRQIFQARKKNLKKNSSLFRDEWGGSGFYFQSYFLYQNLVQSLVLSKMVL